ncbi:hypothetical protein EZJ43_11690 [Pedobacter changchengzhani]|uniref:Uncharacterized protein n=1 Tax=Pedobacter changchengzhani TaxID=2529274 RepID=A0A4R5MJF4_9SPHI|nr:hypothetical protein [Pedobacter changchengzhani]TDG35678.1 hypothetical protein EZJ43_11690 [Pedobacter changchengzhani]
MKKFTIALTREYIVEIEAINEDDAKHFVEYYVSGGKDDSIARTRKKENFRIIEIKPVLNETLVI